ncbi:hypothetical protein PHISP_05285 [Aspergillus sp. HF37]|nr:hypothetical protein PHISP_05285 [Aspergillus sp. HF37]
MEPGSSPRDSGSQAWIAGAVIGPVAGCAILAGLGFWFFRRRHAKPRDEVAAPTAAAGAYPPKSSGDGPAELPASQERPISELPGSFGQFLGERPVSELEAP